MNLSNKNAWKRLSREFNEYAAQDSYRNRRSLKVSHTSLFPIHSAGRGPNPGEPTLLEFGTRIVDANALYFHYESKFGSLEVYVRSQTGGRGSPVFFDVRKDGKTYSFTYEKTRDESDLPYFIRNLKSVAKTQGRDSDVYFAEDVREEMLKQGFSIIAEFEYTERIRFQMPHHGHGFIKPTYVKETKTALEIGWVSSGTYNSIPQVLRVEKSRGIKTVSLRDLGIEQDGYYDGHYRCEIQAHQAEDAKRFFSKRFKRSKNKTA